MIASKSQSQATLPDERSGRLTSYKIGDSVLYHSLPGWQAPEPEIGRTSNWSRTSSMPISTTPPHRGFLRVLVLCKI